jgi:hypothetical protein
MAYESSVTIGSGLNPAKLLVPVNAVSKERHLRGTDVVVLNPEDASAGIGGATTQLTLSSGVPALLPSAPLTYRRAVAIRNFNTSTGTLYVGFTSGVTVADGYPLEAGESFPIQANGAIGIWGITDVEVDVRVIELA